MILLEGTIGLNDGKGSDIDTVLVRISPEADSVDRSITVACGVDTAEVSTRDEVTSSELGNFRVGLTGVGVDSIGTSIEVDVSR